MISIENLTVSYHHLPVFQSFHAKVGRGENVVFTGGSGTGKTTLINALLGFVPLQEGSIKIFGQEMGKENIQTIRNRIAYVPQEINIPFDKVETVLYEPFTFRNNKDRRPDEQRVRHVLKTLNLPVDILEKNMSEISGGQKQRILLASSFLLDKPLVILDEPTTGLDEVNIRRIAEWLNSREDVTLLSTSHNPVWIEYADKTFNLENHGTNA